MFSVNEKAVIALFFGISDDPSPHALPEYFFLESNSLQHASGDHLSVSEDKFQVLVHENDEQVRCEFQRDFPGLVAALEKVTLSVA